MVLTKEFSERILGEYVQAILDGKSANASMIIEEMIKRDLGIADIYLNLIAPAQQKVGNLWYEGKINVAQEHLASEITIQQMQKVSKFFAPSKFLNLEIAVTSVQGDPHSIGGRMIADLFYTEGWTVYFLGANIPSSDILEFVRRKKLDVLALSVTLVNSIEQAGILVQSIKSLPTPPKIIIGGRACDQVDLPKNFCDFIVRNSRTVVKDTLELLGIKQEKTLEQHLQRIGKRIQELRKSNGWSQQFLANKAGLERTYISTVERGKQNLTIGVLFKLATALNVPLENLII